MTEHLVFIHGSGDSGRIWRLQLEHFGSQHALALDLPGHGGRPDTLPVEATVQDYAHSAYEIIMRELHLSKPIIVGHSLGGAIALMMALDYGKELGGIILIGTGARLRVLPSILTDAKNSPEEARTTLSKFALSPTNEATMTQSVLKEQDALSSSILYRDLAACNIFDAMSQLYEISLPTLIICGAEDRLTPLKYSEYLHQHILHSTLQVIPEAGHYVMREQPEQVNQAIEVWMQNH